MQIQNIGGSIDETTCELEFELKAINEDTLESTVLHLCNIVKKQLEDAEYFATKAKSFHAKLKIIGQNDNNECNYFYYLKFLSNLLIYISSRSTIYEIN